MRSTLQKRRRRGQAVVEFALSSVLIFLIVSAAIDLGLVFFTYQAVASSAQEGASYGALRIAQEGNATLNQAVKDDIRLRVRNESYYSAGVATNARDMGIVELTDLDSNDVDDADEMADELAWREWIYVDARSAGTGIASDADCMNPNFRFKVSNCNVAVQVAVKYKPFFLFSSAFGADGTIKVAAWRTALIRNLTQ